MLKDILTFSLLIVETSEVASPASETLQPITTEMEVDKPEAEQGDYFHFSHLGPFEMRFIFFRISMLMS